MTLHLLRVVYEKEYVPIPPLHNLIRYLIQYIGSFHKMEKGNAFEISITPGRLICKCKLWFQF